MIKEVREQLNQLASVFNTISKFLEGKIVGNNERQTLLVSYFDISMEHAQSIHLLMQNEFYGSAVTLLRPFYETYFRGLWMLKFANDKEIKGIYNNTFHFSSMGNKIKALDSIYTGTDFFEKLKTNIWNTLCDYNHSGILQLSRRWKKDELVPNYKDTEIIEAIEGTKIILLLFAYVVFTEHHFEAEAKRINELILNINT